MKELNEQQRKALDELNYPVNKANELLTRMQRDHPLNLLHDKGMLGDVFIVCGLYGAFPNPQYEYAVDELRRLSNDYSEIHNDIHNGGNPTYSKISTAMALRTCIDVLTWAIYTTYRDVEVFGCARFSLRYDEAYYIPEVEEWKHVKYFIENNSLREVLDGVLAKIDRGID